MWILGHFTFSRAEPFFFFLDLADSFTCLFFSFYVLIFKLDSQEVSKIVQRGPILPFLQWFYNYNSIKSRKLTLYNVYVILSYVILSCQECPAWGLLRLFFIFPLIIMPSKLLCVSPLLPFYCSVVFHGMGYTTVYLAIHLL